MGAEDVSRRVLQRRNERLVSGEEITKAHAARDSEALRLIYRAMVGFGKVIQAIPGSTRPELDYVAADIQEAGILLGLLPDAEVRRPTSAWPEGEERE